MRNKIYLFLLCFTGCFISCDSFLDLQPKGIVIPRYYEDYREINQLCPIIKGFRFISEFYDRRCLFTWMTGTLILTIWKCHIGTCTRSKRKYSGMQKQMGCGNIRITVFITITR